MAIRSWCRVSVPKSPMEKKKKEKKSCPNRWIGNFHRHPVPNLYWSRVVVTVLVWRTGLRLGARLSWALAWPGALALGFTSAFPHPPALSTQTSLLAVLAYRLPSFRASTFLLLICPLLPTIQLWSSFLSSLSVCLSVSFALLPTD